MTEAIHIPREVFEHLDPLYKAAATVLAENGGCIIDGKEEVHADE
ncbi:MAG: hypothetical protein PWP08_893 [Methanofollis sp.]|nr:hypothetical protein [Methanofollis sp.]